MKLPYMEGCTFTNAYEHPQSFRIGDVVESGGVASVGVHFLYRMHATTDRWTDEAQFVYRNGLWLLDDVRHNVGSEHQKTLREHLRFAPKQ
jgi:hypothetical protein